MDTNRFFELLRSFTQLTSLQLERAQEHLRYHMQQDLLLQVLTERQTTLPVCPHWGRLRKRNLKYVKALAAAVAA